VTRTIAGVHAGGGWTQAGVSTALVVGYAVPYAVRARALKGRGQPVPPWRLACFGAGVILLALAISPPLTTAADARLSAHMVEHLLLGDLAPLLLVLGLSGPLLAPVLRTEPFRHLRPLSHPLPAVLLWAAGLYGWHLRPAYEAATDHALVHVLEHATFFALGVNLWFALLGPLPKPAWFNNGARLGYIVTVKLTAAMLAYGFVWAGTVFYPHYADTAAQAGRDALADQSAAGAVMLVEQSVVMLALFGWLVGRTLRDAERRQELAELATAHGVALDEKRIARAVAAGRGDALAHRLRETPQRSAQ
jgi:cytochrome c oxidase assembly factor CtaG